MLRFMRANAGITRTRSVISGSCSAGRHTPRFLVPVSPASATEAAVAGVSDVAGASMAPHAAGVPQQVPSADSRPLKPFLAFLSIIGQ